MDAVPLRDLRFFCLGDLGSTFTRWVPRGSPLPHQPVPKGSLELARPGGSDRSQSNTFGILSTDGSRSCGPKSWTIPRFAVRGVGGRGIGIVEPGGMASAASRSHPGFIQFLRTD